MGLLSGSVLSIGPLNLNARWFGEDQRAKHHKNTYLKEIGLHFSNSNTYSTLKMNTIDKTYVPNQEINKHAVPITMTK